MVIVMVDRSLAIARTIDIILSMLELQNRGHHRLRIYPFLPVAFGSEISTADANVVT